MKKINLLLGISIFISGCYNPSPPNADLSTGNTFISLKEQDLYDKGRHVATYIIRSKETPTSSFYNEVKLVLPDNFGDTGDFILFSNNVMYTVHK